MVRRSRVEKSYKKFTGESKYQIKQKKRGLKENLESKKYKSFPCATSKQEYHSNYCTEIIKTSTGIVTKINYFTGPISLQVISRAKNKDIYALMIKSDSENIMYSLKQSGYHNVVSLAKTFKELYDIALWLTPQGTIELNSIEETLRKKITPIEKHLGIELNLD